MDDRPNQPEHQSDQMDAATDDPDREGGGEGRGAGEPVNEAERRYGGDESPG